jgi:hypothetical protein
MGWIIHQEPYNHKCKLPNRYSGNLDLVTPGDIWACDTCGRVWEVRKADYSGHLNWYRAGWWTQRKYAPRYSCGCRIDKPQTKWCKNQPHPGQHTFVCHGGDMPRARRTIEEIESTPPDD